VVDYLGGLQVIEVNLTNTDTICERFKNGRNHTNCEAVSTEGCRRLKASGKAKKCFIYHNMELGKNSAIVRGPMRIPSAELICSFVLVRYKVVSHADLAHSFRFYPPPPPIVLLAFLSSILAALEWEGSQRKVMYDPTKADFFLQYVPQQLSFNFSDESNALCPELVSRRVNLATGLVGTQHVGLFTPGRHIIGMNSQSCRTNDGFGRRR